MWLPLESNPEMLTTFARRVGMPSSFTFTDVFGLDEELLMMVPQPCYALTLLFPVKKMGAFKKEQRAQIEASGQTLSPKLFYVTQHDSCGNACGTIAAVHALANSGIPIEGAIQKFVASQSSATPDERGHALENETDLKEASESSATGGQTETPDRNDDLDNHFICFVPVEGHLYELDGRKAFPINHGPSSPETFLSDSAKVIREKFMANDPDSLNFNVMALVLGDD
eukprot:CAMPEP_0118935704 /NCGR_PEP_ID=MMETSP1169-20130426/15785_1 /TAXON_ID=36882 /ORGANISM="Pyramimonas obovata, Strain CCMP722" /LENGTH=226 /DNA_ID=CAMNT_0006878763 /DNA_START=50 /DNA_END=730 /DNA_ORIENTATION=-